MNSRHSVSLNEASFPLFVGVDVGGTSIKIGFVDDDGRTLIKDSIPTNPERGPEDAMCRVSEHIKTLAARLQVPSEKLRAVGLATPGTMNRSKGVLLEPHNLPSWWNFPIRDCLREACGKPVSFANDANAAAFGEYWVGSGSEFHSIAFFTLGTGVGGGIIIGDLTVEGENSAGSELGHTIIDYTDSARMCGCGQVGHLEAYASAKAVIKRTQESLLGGEDSSLSARIQSGEELTPLMVAEEAEAGDPLAHEIVMTTAKYLGIGAVNVMHTVDPAAVIFGGAMNFGGHNSKLGRSFLDRIRTEIKLRAFPALRETTVVDFAALGGNAGYIGAAGVSRIEHCD